MRGRRKKWEKRGALWDSIIRSTSRGSAGPAPPQRAGTPDPQHGPQPSQTHPVSHSPPGFPAATHLRRAQQQQEEAQDPAACTHAAAARGGESPRRIGSLGPALLGSAPCHELCQHPHSQTEGAGASGDRLRAQVRKDGGVGSAPF